MKTSYNFNHVSRKEAILEILNKSELPLTPKEVSFSSRGLIKHSTSKVYLWQMRKDGELLSENGRYSVIKTMQGVGKLPRIHNLTLSLCYPVIASTRAEVAIDEKTKILVIFGKKNKKVTAIISAEPPLDHREFRLCIEVFRSIVKDKLGCEISEENINVINFELVEDHESIRPEGVNCLTLKTFDNQLERIYSKHSGTRSEIKVSRGLDIFSVYALLKGGIKIYNFVERMSNIESKIERIERGIRGYSESVYNNNELIKRFLEKMDKFEFQHVSKVEFSRFVSKDPFRGDVDDKS